MRGPADESHIMNSPEQSSASASAANLFSGADVQNILLEKEWLTGCTSVEQIAWCDRAASYLGGHAANREKLTELLELIFCYDAQSILASVESHSVLSRTAAREVLRQLALQLLDGKTLDSELFKKIVTELKEKCRFSGREVFQPLRLALAGRAGEGELDRVILLQDEAAGLAFNAKVKTARERIVEFCAALD
jgi:glutamyl/glutaminyl-tRNA synthetase